MNSARKGNLIRLPELVKGALQIVPDLRLLVTEGPSILLRKQTDNETIGLLFQQRAAKHPHRDFLRFAGDGISYGDANATVNTYACVLQDRGSSPAMWWGC